MSLVYIYLISTHIYKLQNMEFWKLQPMVQKTVHTKEQEGPWVTHLRMTVYKVKESIAPKDEPTFGSRGIF